jgi:hypothetical protein
LSFEPRPARAGGLNNRAGTAVPQKALRRRRDDPTRGNRENAVRHHCAAPLRRLIPVTAACLLTAGCGDAPGVGRTLPVSGAVTLDNAPLTESTTVILFKPDAARGNTSPSEPVGTVDSRGVYRLNTQGKKGAPPGWYKVVVSAIDSRAARDTSHHRPAARSLVPAVYGQASTTPLAVEVVEDPASGAYDLKLSASPPPGT